MPLGDGHIFFEDGADAHEAWLNFERDNPWQDFSLHPTDFAGLLNFDLNTVSPSQKYNISETSSNLDSAQSQIPMPEDRFGKISSASRSIADVVGCKAEHLQEL
jgi:hypothetical protein